MAFTAKLKGVGEESSKPLLAFYLEIDEEGDVVLWCEEESGERWSLLYIDAETGKLVTFSDVSNNIGLAVNEYGRLQVGE